MSNNPKIVMFNNPKIVISDIEPDRLSRLVDVEATAAWRWEKAEQFPDDRRNRNAAELLDRLTPEITALNGSALHLRLETFMGGEITYEISGEISGTLKQIGFLYFPQSGQQLLEDIIADLQRLYSRLRGL
jgi:hypothetical protein